MAKPRAPTAGAPKAGAPAKAELPKLALPKPALLQPDSKRAKLSAGQPIAGESAGVVTAGLSESDVPLATEGTTNETTASSLYHWLYWLLDVGYTVEQLYWLLGIGYTVEQLKDLGSTAGQLKLATPARTPRL